MNKYSTEEKQQAIDLYFKNGCSRSQTVIFPPPLIRRKNSNRVEYNVHFSSYVGTFSIFPFIFRQKEKSHRPSDQ